MMRTVVAFLGLTLSSGPVAAQALPEVGKSSKVCLQSHLGTYVCAEEGGNGIVAVNRGKAGGWETFELHRVSQDKVTLKSDKGQFVCAEGGGGGVVMANRKAAGGWETFKVSIDVNGLVSFQTDNGHWLCAEDYGLLTATRKTPGEWEKFRLCRPEDANVEVTRIEVNVYKIAGVAPLWHTGVVIDGREYFFNTPGTVKSCAPKGMDMPHHRTMVRMAPGNLDRIKKVLAEVTKQFDGTGYDLGKRNCNTFSNALLEALGVPGLDDEYRDNSGLGKFLRQTPGGATASELLAKWPVSDKRLDKAFMEDLSRLARLPADTANELKRFGGTVSDGAKHVGGQISDGFKRAIGK